ncbi:hypothetical protein LMJF_15_0650 [Leishmania major strain Friedlin]|uniref:Uncharacterized protein n=1 Tax=Leishmania major TaxID=5664 RepID=Q4QFC0_LEIMA|nr:hypothetical protein LMJF_15_0650 [Leishmania major strain Friedlin]CAG9571416.1 hypothetical_protein_-_conserved [Leishmania major strain Friedlin]CAJ03289.1 hypothetical protein LMJF_15_0650 [Leishmania major strain Friedlin]|eukprot:XP_001681978.1 hypothetical protein LMJF_15_0650 [Leishmania major strain Friedlin]
MSVSSVPREDSQGPQRVSVSPLATPNMSPAATQPPQQQPVKAAAMMTSPIMNGVTTPRLLFTWDPYRNVSSSPGNTSAVAGGAAAKPPEEEVVEEVRLASSIDGCSTTSSVNNTNTGAETSAGVTSAARGTSNSTAPSSAATPGGARPPLTISALLGGAGYPNRGSPQLSATTVSLSQQQQMLHQSPKSDVCVAPGSSHSTPSAPVLKRISTSAKDGRQYFLDYSSSPASNSGAPASLATGGMPNLMLPPNMSPMATVTSPSAPAPSQKRHQPPGGMELLDLDGSSSTNISPQAVPLMSPPRSSSSNAGSYLSYGAAAAANSHSILSATPLPPMSSMAQHNPYRTPPIFYAAAHSTSPAVQQQQQQQQHVLHRQDIDDNDVDLVYALESDPSAFIVRLLPPPPPLPELARVLTVPGVVQSLCARWCTYVAAVLKSDAFAAITAAPPPPPSSVTMSREGSNGSTKEELAAWYETAVDWWEKLDQEGTGAIDVRAKSRTVAAAVEVVASGRSRRQPSQNTSGSANGGRYNPQGGVGASGYRGRGGRGGGGYHAGMGTYGYAASTTAHRGGAHPRGGAAAAAAAVGGMATGAHSTGAAATGYRGGRGSGGGGGGGGSGYSYDATMSGGDNQHDIPDEVDPAMHCNTAYYPSSNFNPYAESWHFSGTTGMATGAQQQQQQQRGYGAMNM